MSPTSAVAFSNSSFDGTGVSLISSSNSPSVTGGGDSGRKKPLPSTAITYLVPAVAKNVYWRFWYGQSGPSLPLPNATGSSSSTSVPVKTAISVGNSLSQVPIDTQPSPVASHSNQTECPAGESPGMDSPPSLVASTLVPVSSIGVPPGNPGLRI